MYQFIPATPASIAADRLMRSGDGTPARNNGWFQARTMLVPKAEMGRASDRLLASGPVCQFRGAKLRCIRLKDYTLKSMC